MKIELLSSSNLKIIKSLKKLGFSAQAEEYFYLTFLITNISKQATYELFKSDINILENLRPIQYEKGFPYNVPLTCKDVKFTMAMIDPKTEKTNARKKMNFSDAISLIRHLYFLFIQNGAEPIDAQGLLPQTLATQIILSGSLVQVRNLIIRFSKSKLTELKNLSKVILKMMLKTYPSHFKHLEYLLK